MFVVSTLRNIRGGSTSIASTPAAQHSLQRADKVSHDPVSDACGLHDVVGIVQRYIHVHPYTKRTDPTQHEIEENGDTKMSNATSNQEQDQLMEPTPAQTNPGLARPTDFKIGTAIPGHVQYGDTEAERAALAAEADADGKSKLGAPIPERNSIPSRRNQR